jgi:hypothetical protein
MRRVQARLQQGNERSRLGFVAKTHHMLVQLDLPRAGGISIRRTDDNFHRDQPPVSESGCSLAPCEALAMIGISTLTDGHGGWREGSILL